jgi:hypothetical protein
MASQRAKLFQAAAALVMQTLYPRVVKGDIEPGSAVDVGWQMTDALLTALGQDGKIKNDIKDKFRGEQIGKLEGIAKEKMEPLCLSAFAKRQFGATMPKRAAKTPKA